VSLSDFDSGMDSEAEMTETHMVRVAAVTGAAQGIGRRTAEILAGAGFALALMDLQACTETLASVHALGADAVELIGDICDEAMVARAVQAVRQRWGRVDVLVNNAGISFIAAAETVEAAAFRRVLEVNLVAPFVLSKGFGAMMLAQGSGSIVNVASVAGLMGIGDRSAYNASKHGLIGLTRTLAAEWGGRGVRCNAVCPGWVKTEMDVADQASGGYSDADIEDRVPMGRFASPENIAQAILFLAEPERSGFINGVALPVDGGWTSDGSWKSLRLRKR
jgi:NAD(P)-dependent dehydrogenase (short-subunit alcohol dehydrogenase family)